MNFEYIQGLMMLTLWVHLLLLLFDSLQGLLRLVKDTNMYFCINPMICCNQFYILPNINA